MKVVFLSRTTLFDVPGGDTTQIVKTAEALRKAGIEVDISTELRPDVSQYDIVHLFNLMRPQEVYLQAHNAKRQGKKVALSTIYGPYTEYDQKARPGAGRVLANLISQEHLEYAKIAARAIKNREINAGTASLLLNGYGTLQRKLVDLVDVFLPNSVSEMQRVHAAFPSSASKPYVVVPNAVDATLFGVAQQIPNEMEKFRGCILSVARIEGRKCQLELVRAVRDLNRDLVLIGKPAPNHLKYYEQMKKEAGNNVHFLGSVDHEKLPAFYSLASVHCLVSWMETPGLSSLEAAAMGCNIVVTEKGDTRDYFCDGAFYCEPDSVPSIRHAIESALLAPPPVELMKKVLAQYTWDKAADATCTGYQIALGDSKSFRDK